MFETSYTIEGETPYPIIDRYERLNVLARWAYRMTYGSQVEIHQEGPIICYAEGEYEGHHLKDPEHDLPQIVRVFHSKEGLDLDEIDLAALPYVTEEIFAVDRRVVMRPAGITGDDLQPEVEWQFDPSIDLDDSLLDQLFQLYCANYLLDHLADL